MSNKVILSLHTLPVELVYRILDHLDEFTFLCSMRNVCMRINAIVDNYHRYQVKFSFISIYDFHHFRNISYLRDVFVC
jgi:hypothetical protein